MGSSLTNKLLVNIGSLVAANGAILLTSPRRFAQLRTVKWAPAEFDAALDRLAGNTGRGRAIGGAALAIGVTMIVVGMSRTRLPR